MDVSRNVAICCLALALWTCGGGDIDEEDELGTERNGDPDSYELVILEPSPADTLAAGEAGTQREATAGAVSGDSAGRGGAAQPVEVDTPDAPVAFDPQGDFAIQIGHYQDARIAARVVRELSAEGYPVYTTDSPAGKGVRVRIGYFKTRDEAQRFGRIFKADRGLEFWVDSRTNEK